MLSGFRNCIHCTVRMEKGNRVVTFAGNDTDLPSLESNGTKMMLGGPLWIISMSGLVGLTTGC